MAGLVNFFVAKHDVQGWRATSVGRFGDDCFLIESVDGV